MYLYNVHSSAISFLRHFGGTKLVPDPGGWKERQRPTITAHMCELDSSTIEEAALQEAKQELASSEDGVVLLLTSEKEIDEFYRTRDYQAQDGIILHMEAQDQKSGAYNQRASKPL